MSEIEREGGRKEGRKEGREGGQVCTRFFHCSTEITCFTVSLLIATAKDYAYLLLLLNCLFLIFSGTCERADTYEVRTSV